MNIYADAGLLILGTRMKRISDRFLSEVSKIYKERKIGFEPVWFPVFYLLDMKGPMSLTEIANELEVSHSAISQMIAQLEKKKLVEMVPNDADARVKLMYFTTKGRNLLDEVHAMKLSGKSYLEIAALGGGINTTVAKTREAGFDELLELTRQRAMIALKNGITTIEIKSGYGLDIENELKMLKVIKALDQQLDML